MKQRVQRALLGSSLLLSLIFSHSSSQAAASKGLTEKDLLNINCSISSLGDGPDDLVSFKNGKCKWGDNTGSIICSACGDLNHDGIADGAIVYGYSSGGSGYFTSMTVYLCQKGKAVQIGEISLGDRSNPRKITIKNNKLVLDIMTHKESDPASTPTWHRTLTYTVKDQTIVGPDDVR